FLLASVISYLHFRRCSCVASANSFWCFMRCPCAGRHLLFFASAKKSRCRPAQGQRKKHRYEFADATQKQKAKSKKQKSKKQKSKKQKSKKQKSKNQNSD
ncbi:hypothetical protein, partial [Paraburkholderia sabiae]|uniref:hypothetical protein n=1 Tax=Paraburkholderia sabiae TaxID=273251 RepID=UPI001CC41398